MLIFVLLSVLVTACLSIDVQVSKLNGGGLRFAIKDEPGITLAAVHYSVNTQISGTRAGRWNFDINSKTGNEWIHENRHATVRDGDKVYYWVYAVKNRVGIRALDKSWTVGGASTGSGNQGNTGNTGTGTNTNTGRQTSGGNTGTSNIKPRSNLRLVFEDNFSGRLDTSKWIQEVTVGGGGNNEFQAYTNLAENTYVKDGKLFIKPTLTADKYGESFLTNGVFDMNKMYGTCTSSSFNGCRKEGRHGFLMPVMSGKLKSKTSIRYGRVEIKAKLPRGDWLWPALWMLPQDWKYGGWPRSGEIDIMEAIGNRDFGNRGIQYMGSTLHWGGSTSSNRFYKTHGSTKVSSTPTLADGMHTYIFDWDENGMDFYLDGRKILSIPTPSQGFFSWGNIPGPRIWPNRNSPFDQRFYLVLNVAVGGTNGYIPDDVRNGGHSKPWSNRDGGSSLYKFWKAKNSWLSTWKGEDAAMQIDYVKMWEKA